MSDEDKMIEVNGEYVRASALSLIEAGVTPIEIKYAPISDLYGEEIMALILQYSVHNLVTGEITSDEAETLDDDTIAALFFRLIRKAYTLITKLRRLGSNIKWIAVPCPKAVIGRTDVGERIRAVTNGDIAARGLRVMIRKNALSDKAAVAAFTSEMGNEGIKTVIEGFGDEDFPLRDMLGLLPDALVMTGLLDEITDRTKAPGVRALIDYAKSLKADVIASGVSRDEQVRELRAADVFGLIPAADYSGVYDFIGKPLEAIAALMTAREG